jgi:anaerobic selenocysteine-containing dehydrogenase
MVGPITEKVFKSCCNLCYRMCGVLVHVRDGKVSKVEGDPECPANLGSLCIKGLAAVETLYHPDRLKYPLKRTGARGEGKWQRVSWDEALETIAQAMNKAKEKNGAESVVFSHGDPKGFEHYIVRLCNVFGTPNICDTRTVCSIPRRFGATITCGYSTIGTDVSPDLDYPPACILMWGANIAFTHLPNYVRLQKALKQGMKLVVIDPRETSLAARAHLWLQPRPKSDLALALGMTNIIISEGLYETSFVDEWTVGFNRLREHVKDYPVEKVEEITWVPKEKIIEAARLYATTKPASIQDGNSMDDDLNSVQTARAIAILRAITGNLGIPGGDIDWADLPLGLKPTYAPGQAEALSFTLDEKMNEDQRNKMIGADEGFAPVPMVRIVPSQLLVKAILSEKPYPVKVLCVHANNPLMTWANAQEVYKAIMALDFLYVSDQFMTPSAELADIVLPAATYLEVNGIAFRSPFVHVRQKVTQIGEAWPDKNMINEMAKKLGLGQYFWEDVDEALDIILKPMGLTFEEFRSIGNFMAEKGYRRHEVKGFNTPSGKVEIYSSLFEKWGYDPIPVYYEPPETPYSAPELAEEYPLIFTTWHHEGFRHSNNRQVPSLRGREPHPVVEIHPETAKNLDIEDGDWVYIENKRGRIKQRAVLTEGIDPRVVAPSYGWWFPEQGVESLHGWKESNINVLTYSEPPYNPQIASTNLRGTLCRVYKGSE